MVVQGITFDTAPISDQRMVTEMKEVDPMTEQHILRRESSFRTDIPTSTPDDNIRVDKPRRSTQYLAAFAGCLGSIGSGAVMGYSSPAGPQLVERMDNDSLTINVTSTDLVLTPIEYSLFSSVPNVAAAIAGPLAGWTINAIGRRGTMLAAVLPFMVSWLMTALAKDLWLLLGGRVLGGLYLGTISVVVPTYIGEFASPDVRGVLGAGFQLFSTVGLLLVYIIGSAVHWRMLAMICIVFPVIFGATTLVVRESPTFLLMKGKNDQAALALRWFRGSQYDINSELLAATRNIRELEAEGRIGLRDIGRPYILKPLIVSLGLMFFQQLCGINAIIFNANLIFTESGSSLGPEMSSIAVAATQMMGTLIASLLMDKLGRKLLLLFSSAVMAVSLVAVGVFFYVREENNEASKNLGWLPLVGLVVFVFAFALAFGPIPWLMMGELFPRNAREITSSIASTFNWSLSFLVTLGFVPLQTAIGSAAVYWVFASLCGCAFVFCLTRVPETKGRTLEEISEMFGNPVL